MLNSVAVIVVSNFSIFEFGTAFEVFGIDRSARGSGVPAFDFRVCTPKPGDVRLKSGLTMHIDLGLEAAADADLVIMAPSAMTRRSLKRCWMRCGPPIRAEPG
ncbi:hypothetical protein D9M72_285220 [compost metagenome]